MTELSLILGLNLLALLFVAALTRWVFAHDVEPAEARGLVTAMRGAVASFRLRQLKWSLVVLVVLAVAAASVAYHFSDLPLATAYLVGGIFLGGSLSMALGQLALTCGMRCAAATATALRGPSSSVLILALRGAALVALSVEIWVGLVVALALLLLVMLHGNDVASWLPTARVLFAGVGLGCLGPSVVVHLSGASLANAGETGLVLLDPSTQSRFRLEPRNPSMVTSAVGPQLGPLLGRAQDISNLSLLCHLVVVAASLSAVEHGGGTWIFGLLATPMLIRACGAIGSAIAISSVRADDGDEPVEVLFRGQLAAAALGAAGIVGSCRWLLGDGTWAIAVSIGLLALLGHTAVTLLAKLWAERRSRFLNAVREAATVSSEAAHGLGLASAGLLCGLSLLLVVATMSAGLFVASHFEMPESPAIALALSAFFSTISFSLAIGSTGPVIETACGLCSLGPDGAKPQALSRLSSLDFLAAAGGSMAQAQFAAGSTLLGGSIALVLLPGIALDGVSAFVPVIAAFFGAMFVIALASLALRHAADVNVASSQESARQLRSFGRDGKGSWNVPPEFSPSYKDQLQRVTDRAMSNLVPSLLVCLVLPLALGTFTRHWFGSETLIVGVAWFLAVCGLTGGAFASIAAAAAGLVSAARRHSRASNSQHQSSLNRADLFAHTVGSVVAASSRLAVAGAAATGLVLVAVVT